MFVMLLVGDIQSSDLAAQTIDGEVLDVIDAQPQGSTVTYTFSCATDYTFALCIGIKLSNNTTAALLIDDNGNLVWNRKSGGYWRGWKTAIASSDIFVKRFSTSVTIQANELKYFDVPFSTPSEYEPVMVTIAGNGYAVGGTGWVVGYGTTSASIVIKNHLERILERTVSIDVLFRRK